MGRRDDIRKRLEAAEAAKPGPWEVRSGFSNNVYIAGGHHLEGFVAYAPDTADLIAHAPADLRDLLAVADAAAVVIRAIISQGAGPAAPIFDEFDAAVEAARGSWFKVDGEAIDSLRAALDRLDNGGS